MNIRPRNERAEVAADTPASLAVRDCYRPPVDTDTLVRLEHENTLEWLRIETEPVPGSVIRVVDGVAVYATGQGATGSAWATGAGEWGWDWPAALS